ncbi:hypothetical protein Tco_0114896 [Tanacetum coccineum]
MKEQTYNKDKDQVEKLMVDLKNLLGQWFPAQSVRSMNEYASNSSYSPFLITRTSQRRQHDKSESVSYYLAD